MKNSGYQNSYLPGETINHNGNIVGVLGLYFAENNPDISALLLYSTALLVGNLRYADLLMLATSAIEMNKPNDVLPWQGYTVYPLWAADQFHRLTKKVKNNISSVEVPTSYFKANMIKK